ncbi:MAG: MBL fold metallo-hydrolase [Gammaproteobacteria bacterium]|nr:MBL fold metallo-hydrolase [Gammaproteobacteria bacterium]
MNTRQLFDQDTGTYTYLIWDEESGEAAIIDSVREQFERDSNLIIELGLTLKYTLETHVHADHVTASGLLRDEFDATVVLHKNSESRCADLLVDDGDQVQLGEQVIEMIHTPGHTNTDITYKVDEMLFTGDTLLIRGCGRTDFQSGDADTLYSSITEKLFTLDDNTIVYPGHDYIGRTVSSIGEEKRLNPRLAHTSREEFIAIMDGLVLDPPKRIKESVPGNLACGLKAAA